MQQSEGEPQDIAFEIDVERIVYVYVESDPPVRRPLLQTRVKIKYEPGWSDAQIKEHADIENEGDPSKISMTMPAGASDCEDSRGSCD